MRCRPRPYHQHDLHRDVGREPPAGAGVNFSRRPLVTEEESAGRAGVAVRGCPVGAGVFMAPVGAEVPSPAGGAAAGSR